MNGFMKPEKIKSLEKTLGYSFQDKSLLIKALSHSSFVNERHLQKINSNERLEFLGDAVLELVTSEFLFFKYKNLREGELTKLRAASVCEPTLAFCARKLNLSNYLLLGNGEILTGGKERDSILSDALEAVIGAIYLDGGLTNVKEFVYQHLLDDVEGKKLFYDSKTIFQEMIQSKSLGPIRYHLIGESGPDHSKLFQVAVFVGDFSYGTGEGSTKKAAEQLAAYNGILRLKKENNF